MIEKDGVLIHVDPKGDRFQNQPLHFSGWVAAKQPIRAVWLPAAGTKPLLLSHRPDVERVFPHLISSGFVGQTKARDIGPRGLRITVELEEFQVEVEYPLPPPLRDQPFWKETVMTLHLLSLRLQERLARSSERRWQLTLQRHLVHRRQRSGLFRRSHTEALLFDFATAMPDATFLQIGANDGLTGDPIHHLITRPDTRWRGILVEPVRHLFAQLSARYGGNSLLHLECAAIGENDGVTVVHRLEPSRDHSLWLDQIPSLDPQILQRTATQLGRADAPIVSEKVACLRVDTLLQNYRVTHLDLLVIDTEGWDWRILRQFDLALLQPKLILYEHQHLSEVESDEAHQFLRERGYDWVATEEGDTLAWKYG